MLLHEVGFRVTLEQVIGSVIFEAAKRERIRERRRRFEDFAAMEKVFE